MLKIKPKFRITFPRFTFWSHRPELSRPVPEDDELIVAIDTDTETHDDNWQLLEHPDTQQLTEYWTKVEDDVLHDPQWAQVEQ